jgi:hypothetical protein
VEFWEGAILVIGGVWLVGTMARKSATSPINKATTSIVAAGTVTSAGNTIATNTDGSTSLIAGEQLGPSAPSILVNKTVSVNAPSTPVVNPPIAVASPLRSILGRSSAPIGPAGTTTAPSPFKPVPQTAKKVTILL